MLGNFSALTREEESLIKTHVGNEVQVQLGSALAYGRLLLNGIIYTNSNYRPDALKCDAMICFSGNFIGEALKFVSYCTSNCTCFGNDQKCHHVVIVRQLMTMPTKATHIKVANYSQRYNNNYY